VICCKASSSIFLQNKSTSLSLPAAGKVLHAIA
jgi:hypothetical protein